MKFVVHRPNWLRGDRPSGLLKYRFDPNTKEHTGKRCCLGFLGKALGIPDDVLNKNSHLTHIAALEHHPLRAALRRRDDEQGRMLETAIVLANDNDDEDKDREDKLTALFAEAGLEIVFTDEPEST